MAKKRLKTSPLSATDLQDLVNGAALLGSGGGGSLAIGQQIIRTLSGSAASLIEPGDVPADGQMAVTSFFGDPAMLARLNINYGSLIAAAFEALQDVKQTTFSFVLPLETGAGNSLIPLALAALKNIPVVDADGGRRALPAPQAAPWAALPVAPLALASTGASLTLNTTSMQTALEAMMPILLSVPPFDKGAALAMWAMTGAQMQQTAISGSVSFAIQVGATIRQACASGSDPVQAVITFVNGKLLFIGQLQGFTQGAQKLGTTVIHNQTGSIIIYNMPDNLIAWDPTQDMPLAMAPDSICFMTTAGQPLSVADLGMVKPGDEIAVIGIPAVAPLKTGPLLAIYLSVLNAIGYAGAYQPL